MIRHFSLADAPFILGLLNEPSFIENIADRGVRTLDDARAYLLSGPLASYEQFGFGLWLVLKKDDGIPIGMCGLLKRDALDDVDIGYAFLPAFCAKGYALESATAVLAYGQKNLGFNRIVAVVNADNTRSIRLLEKVGFTYERLVRLSDEGKEVKLWALEQADVPHSHDP